jgi:hypothetical protein
MAQAVGEVEEDERGGRGPLERDQLFYQSLNRTQL